MSFHVDARNIDESEKNNTSLVPVKAIYKCTVNGFNVIFSLNVWLL